MRPRPFLPVKEFHVRLVDTVIYGTRLVSTVSESRDN
jgi:hypothetical protein